MMRSTVSRPRTSMPRAWSCPILIFLLGAIIAVPVRGQVYNGNLELTSQEEVDAFFYTGVNGHLSITGDGITDLSGLDGLQFVTGSVAIYSTGLVEIDGFSSLDSVGVVRSEERRVGNGGRRWMSWE